MPHDLMMERVLNIRRFNRFYTLKIGVVDKYLKSNFSVTEVRVLFEIERLGESTASDLIEIINCDPGYLSRILKHFQKNKLIKKKKSKNDGRQRILTITAKGRKILTDLNNKAIKKIHALIEDLSDEEQERLLNAMDTIETLLSGAYQSSNPCIFRTFRPGDIGYITYRHGVLFADEFGFDIDFEADVANGLAKFSKHYHPEKEHLWIAEIDGEPIGSVAIRKSSNIEAELGWFLLEPKARGRNIGKGLLTEALTFAKYKGYQKVTVTTENILVKARSLYKQAGFQLIEEQPEAIWGRELIKERWELLL